MQPAPLLDLLFLGASYLMRARFHRGTSQSQINSIHSNGFKTWHHEKTEVECFFPLLTSFFFLSASFPLTSRQTDGSTAFPLGKVVRADVNLLLAQPPQAEVGCLAGLVDFGHPRAEHSPVVRDHRREHASHTHQQYEDGYVYLCALVHVSSCWELC